MPREGEKNGRAKLTWPHVQLLRQQYKLHFKGKFNRHPRGMRSPYSTAALADEYEMSQGSMWQALKGETWKKSKEGP